MPGGGTGNSTNNQTNETYSDPFLSFGITISPTGKLVINFNQPIVLPEGIKSLDSSILEFRVNG
jgi:hypothetical protein